MYSVHGCAAPTGGRQHSILNALVLRTSILHPPPGPTCPSLPPEETRLAEHHRTLPVRSPTPLLSHLVSDYPLALATLIHDEPRSPAHGVFASASLNLSRDPCLGKFDLEADGCQMARPWYVRALAEPTPPGSKPHTSSSTSIITLRTGLLLLLLLLLLLSISPLRRPPSHASAAT